MNLTDAKPFTISHLSYEARNKQILTDIEVVVEKGFFYGIVGPNGSGKTTFLRALSKVLDVNPQTVYVDGKDIQSISVKKLGQTVACVPQNTYVDNDFTAFDVVIMGRSPHKKAFETDNRTDYRMAMQAMEMTNTSHLRDVPLRCLSGGERQRVFIARAISQETEIMLLDEPVANLDIHHQLDILNLLGKLNSERKVTIVAVLHDLNHVLSFTQKVFLISEGRLAVCGNTSDVLVPEKIRNYFGVNADFMINPLNGKRVLVTA